jgi:hypothetical protein
MQTSVMKDKNLRDASEDPECVVDDHKGFLIPETRNHTVGVYFEGLTVNASRGTEPLGKPFKERELDSRGEWYGIEMPR